MYDIHMYARYFALQISRDLDMCRHTCFQYFEINNIKGMWVYVCWENSNIKNLNEDLCKKDYFKHETIFGHPNILNLLQQAVKINK